MSSRRRLDATNRDPFSKLKLKSPWAPASRNIKSKYNKFQDKQRNKIIGDEEDGEFSPDYGKGAEPEFFEDLDEKKVKGLRGWNIAAAVIIGVAWAATFILWLIWTQGPIDHSLVSDWSTDLSVYDGGSPDAANIGRFTPAITLLGIDRRLAFLIPIIIFSFPSAIIHIITVAIDSLFQWYSRYALSNSYNSIKWLDKMISCSILMLLVLPISGLSNIIVMIAFILVNIGVIASMWILETVNQKRSRRRVNWEPLYLALLLGLAVWGTIAFYYFNQNLSSPDLTPTPWFYWIIPAGVFALVLAALIATLIHFSSKERTQSANYNYEIFWIIINIIFHLFVDSVLTIALILTAP